MIVPLSLLAFAASIISSNSLAVALSPSNISPDIPVASLISEANAHLAKGETSDAITYYDVAILRDPKNYLTLFKRGATYLSLGRTSQALSDFDAVLEIKHDFEGALVQRAKIMSNYGDWETARKSYLAAGHAGNDLAELEEAEGAAKLAADAEKKKDLEGCITHAGVAIMVANKNLALRQLRARCRFERGEMQEGISDLAHVLHIQPGLTDPHLQISSVQFFSLADTERGMAQVRKCLISDPDSKSCKKLHRTEKQIDKALKKVQKLFEKRSFSTAAKYIVGSGEYTGLMQDIKEEFKGLHTSGMLPSKAPNELYAQVVEMACEAHIEVGAFAFNVYYILIGTQMKSKKTPTYCAETLELNPNSLNGLLWKAQQSFDAENYEACIHTLNTANEHHDGNAKIKSKLNEAQKALRQSKEKVTAAKPSLELSTG